MTPTPTSDTELEGRNSTHNPTSVIIPSPVETEAPLLAEFTAQEDLVAFSHSASNESMKNSKSASCSNASRDQDRPLRNNNSQDESEPLWNKKKNPSVSALIPQELLQNLILEPTLDPEKGFNLQSFDAILDPENVDLTVPTKKWPQVMAAIAVSFGSLIVGLASAYTSPAIASMHEPNSTLFIELEGEEASWIGSLMPLGALVGGILGGTLVEKVGRKRTILGTAIPFILSWLLIAFASNIYMIYVARGITGVCVGIICLSLPVYLAETVQPEVRGMLGLLPTTVGNLGILVVYVAGTYLNWSNLAFLCAALSFPFLFCVIFVPETPRWYIANGMDEKGEKSLQWFRGAGADIKTELNQIRNAHIMSKKYQIKLKDLLGKAYVKPLLVSIGLMFFQQFSGINAVIFYSKSIFSMSGSTLDANLCSIILGLMNISATIFATFLIDRLGRKVLLLMSSSLMVLTLGSLGTFFFVNRELVKDPNPKALEEYVTEMGLGWIPLVSLMLYVLAFSIGFGPIPWLMLGEIFPSRIRGSAAAMATSFNWSCTFLVTLCFPIVTGALGAYAAFYGFCLICILGIPFIIFCVPETRGQSLEDIERNLPRPFRRISSTANLKPFPMSM